MIAVKVSKFSKYRKKCPICDRKTKIIKEGKLEEKYIKKYVNFRFPSFFGSFLFKSNNGFKNYEISQCNSCDFIYHSKILRDIYRELPPYTDDTIEVKTKKRFFQIQSQNFIINKYLLLLAKSLLKSLSKNKIVNFLDFGCGWGDTIKIAASLKFNSFGTEINEDKIKYLKENNINLLNMQKNKKLFDIILCNQVFEHLERPQEIAKLISKTLKKDGIFVIAVPNGSLIKFLIKIPALWLIKNKGLFSMNPIWFFGHINCFSRKSLITIFEKNNMQFYNLNFSNYMQAQRLFEKKSDKISLLLIFIKMKLNFKTLLFFRKI